MEEDFATYWAELPPLSTSSVMPAAQIRPTSHDTTTQIRGETQEHQICELEAELVSQLIGSDDNPLLKPQELDQEVTRVETQPIDVQAYPMDESGMPYSPDGWPPVPASLMERYMETMEAHASTASHSGRLRIKPNVDMCNIRATIRTDIGFRLYLLGVRSPRYPDLHRCSCMLLQMP